ncbi:MAG: hypothetical protein A2169_11450 [Deltaproteobacteria bacterium RBG_13_47_9]|nr:MAG: hypothetical protein A2169_11450 [Deltaproteobacteria bacterium RBG_13_47_9]
MFEGFNPDTGGTEFQGSRKMLSNYKELKALIKPLENIPLNPRILAHLFPTNWEKNQKLFIDILS